LAAAVTAGCFHALPFVAVAIAGKVLNLLETLEHARYGWGMFLVCAAQFFISLC